MKLSKKIEKIFRNRDVVRLEEEVIKLKEDLRYTQKLYSERKKAWDDSLARLDRIIKNSKEDRPTFKYVPHVVLTPYSVYNTTKIDLYLYIDKEEYLILLEDAYLDLIVLGTERLSVQDNIATLSFEYKGNLDDTSPRTLKTYQIDYKKDTYICTSSKV